MSWRLFLRAGATAAVVRGGDCWSVGDDLGATAWPLMHGFVTGYVTYVLYIPHFLVKMQTYRKLFHWSPSVECQRLWLLVDLSSIWIVG